MEFKDNAYVKTTTPHANTNVNELHPTDTHTAFPSLSLTIAGIAAVAAIVSSFDARI